MKKILLSVAVVALGFAVTTTSCKKEEQVVETKSFGSISGMAYANLNEANDTLVDGQGSLINETVPEGTIVIATVNPMDYSDNPDATVNYEELSYQTAVLADGSYSLDTIIAYANGVSVELRFTDFVAETTIYDPLATDTFNFNITETTRNVYTAANQTITLSANDLKIIDVLYSK